MRSWVLFPKEFVYHRPNTLDEAFELLETLKNCKIIAGGQSLIPLMKLRLAEPSHIIDINRIPNLDYIRQVNNELRIGCLARISDIENSDLIRRTCPMLSECASTIADPLVRNMGTIGGNIAHADPNNDVPAALLALDGKIVAASKAGFRIIDADDFFLDAFTTVLRPNEIVKEVRIPINQNRACSYVKVERNYGDYGIVGVAVAITLNGDICERCIIALAGVSSKVTKAYEASKMIEGKKITTMLIKKASDIADTEAKPVSDIRGSEEFKRRMIRMAVLKALTQALKRIRKSA